MGSRVDHTESFVAAITRQLGIPGLNIQRTATANLNTDQATRDTVHLMRDLAQSAALTPTIEQAARNFELLQSCNQLDVCRRVWLGLKRTIRFQADDVLVGDKELLISPEVTLSENNIDPVGDCDDFSMCVMSLLAYMGIPSWFVTVAADNRMPGGFSHIYVRAQAINDAGVLAAVPMDVSHGKWFGWEVEDWRVTRKQEWRGV